MTYRTLTHQVILQDIKTANIIFRNQKSYFNQAKEERKYFTGQIPIPQNEQINTDTSALVYNFIIIITTNVVEPKSMITLPTARSRRH